jgi:hypothetical protein
MNRSCWPPILANNKDIVFYLFVSDPLSCSSISDLVQLYPTLSLRLEAVFNLLTHGDADVEQVSQWALEFLYPSAKDVKLLHTVDDGRAIVDIALIYLNPTIFHQEYTPRHLSDSASAELTLQQTGTLCPGRS